MKLKAILFDFDMTLIDTSKALLNSANKMQSQFGKPLCDMKGLLNIIGLNSHDYWLALMGDEKPEYGRFYMAECAPYEYDIMVPAEGALEALKELRDCGLKVGCASNRNNPMRAIGPKGLEPMLDCVVGADNVEHPKPAPDVLLLGCEKLGVKPEECLYIGDTAIDVNASNHAGMRCVAVLTSNTRETLEAAGAWKIVPTLKDLIPLLKSEGML